MRFVWPVQGAVTRNFYYQSSLYVGGQHAAIDIAAPSGTPIAAVADGVVSGKGWDPYSGHFVALDHVDGWQTFYRHLYGDAPVVVGQPVKQGRGIGLIGSTGTSTGPHLHFDLWNISKVRNDDAIFYKHDIWAVDPELYLGKEDDVGFAEDIASLQENQTRIDRQLQEVAVMVFQARSDIEWLKGKATTLRKKDEWLDERLDKVEAALPTETHGHKATVDIILS